MRQSAFGILKRLLLVLAIVFVSLEVLFGLWFLIIRFTPLTYWGYLQVKHLKYNRIYNYGYMNLFYKPINFFNPKLGRFLISPMPRSTTLVEEKGWDGKYNYESYGVINSVVKNDLTPVTWNISMTFDDGRKEEMVFNQNTSVLFGSVKPKETKYYDLYLLERVGMTELMVGDEIRCRFKSPLDVSYYHFKKANNEAEELVGIQIMPKWWGF
jgi:hypothetical protein